VAAATSGASKGKKLVGPQGTPSKENKRGGNGCFASDGSERACFCLHNYFQTQSLFDGFQGDEEDASMFWRRCPNHRPFYPNLQERLEVSKDNASDSSYECEPEVHASGKYKFDVKEHLLAFADIELLLREHKKASEGKQATAKGLNKSEDDDLSVMSADTEEVQSEFAAKKPASKKSKQSVTDGKKSRRGESSTDAEDPAVEKPKPSGNKRKGKGKSGRKSVRKSRRTASSALRGGTKSSQDSDGSLSSDDEDNLQKCIESFPEVKDLETRKDELLDKWDDMVKEHAESGTTKELMDLNIYKKARPLLWDVVLLRKKLQKGFCEEEPICGALKSFLYFCFMDWGVKENRFCFFNDPFRMSFCMSTMEILLGQDNVPFLMRYCKKKTPLPAFPLQSRFKHQYTGMCLLQGYARYVNCVDRKTDAVFPIVKDFSEFLIKYDLCLYGREMGNGTPRSKTLGITNQEPGKMMQFLKMHDGSLPQKKAKYNEDPNFWVADADRNYKDPEERSANHPGVGVIFELKGVSHHPLPNVTHPCNAVVVMNTVPKFEQELVSTLDDRWGPEWRDKPKDPNLELLDVVGCRGLKFWSTRHNCPNGLCDLVSASVLEAFLKETITPLLSKMLPEGKSYSVKILCAPLISDNVGPYKVVQTGHVDFPEAKLLEWNKEGVIPIIAMMPLSSDGLVLQVYPKGYDSTMTMPEKKNQGKLLMVPQESVFGFPATMFHSGGLRTSPRGNKRIQFVLLCYETGKAEAHFPEESANQYFEIDSKANDPPELTLCHQIVTFKEGSKENFLEIAEKDSLHVSDAVRMLTDIFFLF
jgi:hypothetical protein